jgi:hypothetical protein
VLQLALTGAAHTCSCLYCILQVYWWSERSHSSAARAFTAAQSLHALVTAAVNEDSTSTNASTTTAANVAVLNSVDDDSATEDKSTDMLSDRYPWPTDVLYRMLKGDQLQHGLQLSSAYAQYREVDGVVSEPQYTNATVGFTGTLDYVSALYFYV